MPDRVAKPEYGDVLNPNGTLAISAEELYFADHAHNDPYSEPELPQGPLRSPGSSLDNRLQPPTHHARANKLQVLFGFTPPVGGGHRAHHTGGRHRP